MPAEVIREINFDGIVGPTHNYAGMSLGNLAAMNNAGARSSPREAALQGIAKMRANLRAGLLQGIFVPPPRPNGVWLAQLATDAEQAGPALWTAASSASAMWAANAATVSPAPDTADGRCHLTVANLVTLPHRSHEWPNTLAQLRLAFADERRFAVHGPVPPPFGDEGAANHMRLCPAHHAPGVEVFVYGEPGGRFPARQHRQAGEAIARRHGLLNALFVQQSPEAIEAGAFHNDVVAVANETVLLAHEHAFADKARFFGELRSAMPGVEIIEVPAARVSLAAAVRSYLFNAQLVTRPHGGMTLILPAAAYKEPEVRAWLAETVGGNGPIREAIAVDLRESMANGGGPACLRLRVACDPVAVDPRFLVDEARLDRIEAVVRVHWPDAVERRDFATLGRWPAAVTARLALLHALDLGELAAPAIG